MRGVSLFFFLILICAILSGCMVGPNFHRPPLPTAKTYTHAPLPKKTVSTRLPGSGGKSQYFDPGKNIPAEWWTLFHSAALNHLINRGIIHSPNLGAAIAVLRNAQENLKAQSGSLLYPSVTGAFTAQRQRFSGASNGVINRAGTFTVYNPVVNVSYNLDVFGGAHRQVEAAAAQVEYENFQLEAAYLTLTSNIATTAITIASLREQIRATLDLIQIQTKLLKMVQGQFNLGGASKANVLSQQSQLASTRATLPPLRQQLAAARDSLSTLVGAFPSQGGLPNFNLNTLNLPTDLPVSLPSTLVCQRPDIRAAQAQLHQASANIGVATAALFPSFTLSGAYGYESTKLSNLFSPSSMIWNLTGTVMQAIFKGGSLLAERRAAIATYNQYVAQYQQTVLQAFQNVADTLHALNNDAQTLQAQRQAEIAAEEAMNLNIEQYRLGGVSFITLLDAEIQYQQAKISRIQAEAARYTDTVGLFAALGGGWWNRQPAPALIINVEKQVKRGLAP